MTTPPRLRLVHGGAPPPSAEDRLAAAPPDAADAPAAPEAPDVADEVVDAAFPDDGRPRTSASASAAADDAAQAAARAARVAALARQGVAGLAGFQFLATLRYLRWYASMLRDGAVSPAALLAVPACLALYLAAGLLLARRAPAACRTLFIMASMALAVSVPFWGLTEDWTWPLELGATLALAGAWYSRPAAARRSPQP